MADAKDEELRAIVGRLQAHFASLGGGPGVMKAVELGAIAVNVFVRNRPAIEKALAEAIEKAKGA